MFALREEAAWGSVCIKLHDIAFLWNSVEDEKMNLPEIMVES